MYLSPLNRDVSQSTITFENFAKPGLPLPSHHLKFYLGVLKGEENNTVPVS